MPLAGARCRREDPPRDGRTHARWRGETPPRPRVPATQGPEGRASTPKIRARSLGVDPDLAESILRALIRSSLASQEKERVAAEGKGGGQRVLVIGGAGKMGGWFVDFFESQGYGTVVADASVEPGEDRHADWREAGTDFDVIVVATPLKVSGEILAELADARPRGLVFDIGSLKTPLKHGLAKLKEAGCRVASLHPMFGPDTDLLSGRHLIFVDAGCPEATAMARERSGNSSRKRISFLRSVVQSSSFQRSFEMTRW